MTPKELENLTHKYGMEGNLNDVCINSLYSTFGREIGIYYAPTLLYLGCDEPDTVYISRIVDGEIVNGSVYIRGDIPFQNPAYLTMTQAYKQYKMSQDKEIEAAVASLALQIKQMFEKFKLDEVKKDFEDGTN